ncbi:MAG: phosphoribosylanthranilate isomerase [Miltoncostaeaceae bacterium]
MTPVDPFTRGAHGAPAVKVCGLTRPDEALACARHEVWGIGVVLAPGSPRRVDAATAAAVCAVLPAGVARVGVFVDPEPTAVAAVARGAGLTHIQVHGRADIAALRAATGLPVIRGVRVDGPAALADAEAVSGDLVLLDAAVPGAHGGTGVTFDWDLLEAHRPSRPFGVAGGLSSSNVAEAVARLRPALVDVSSGVERAPGRKDPARVAAFCAAITPPVGASA